MSDRVVWSPVPPIDAWVVTRKLRRVPGTAGSRMATLRIAVCVIHLIDNSPPARHHGRRVLMSVNVHY